MPQIPVIGVLGVAAHDTIPKYFPAFVQGLKERGYVEGRNVAIEYRLADSRVGRLPAFAADLVRRQVAVIATNGGSLTALAAKAATSRIPIVFTTGDDPVGIGLVESLSRPGGNVTGVSMSSTALLEKRLELLRELAPGAGTIALLMSADPHKGRFWNEHTAIAARTAGFKVIVVEVEVESDLEALFASAIQQGADALLVAAAPFFMRRRAQVVALAARHGVPAVYPFREFSEVGGLMSYGPNLPATYLQAGLYTGRILNGAEPGDLPVQLPTKFELVINLKTAKALGLEVSRLLTARVDKVIE
jgi:putative tryptophan/tyrosine transport system substrate-binding protein